MNNSKMSQWVWGNIGNRALGQEDKIPSTCSCGDQRDDLSHRCDVQQDQGLSDSCLTF
jgi:hypothetical protein